MSKLRFYGKGLPGAQDTEVGGKLIVLEGPDGVGRSTQVALLREWLESSGYAVYSSGFKRSELASRGIESAKQGHTMGNLTMALFYAADFADRLEREIIPMLKAGFVVLTDRYIYSMMARARVRGADIAWLRSLTGFAVVPDKVLYLRAEVDQLLPRLMAARGFDFWESGMDYLGCSDYYASFREHQSRMRQSLDEMSTEYAFQTIDASQSIEGVFTVLKAEVLEVIKDLKPDPAVTQK
ncbi:MAG: dTMP kinase [Anaerolineae bacterium]|jgi:dTMP kinase|nr:thymidylate kinase [Chloroflexota bacterium]